MLQPRLGTLFAVATCLLCDSFKSGAVTAFLTFLLLDDQKELLNFGEHTDYVRCGAPSPLTVHLWYAAYCLFTANVN